MRSLPAGLPCPPARRAPWSARLPGRALLLALLVTLLTALLPAATRAAATGAWSTVGDSQVGRVASVAVTLNSGKVLNIGGTSLFGTQASCELYDPVAKTWSQTTSLSVARSGHTATVLVNGKVLVVGGESQAAQQLTEIYDPATTVWSATGNIGTGREGGHTAVRLNDGRVLVAGGEVGGTVLASAELYNPATNTWSPAGTMQNARKGHTVALLGNGKVLVAGGAGTGGQLASAELYNPATNSWSLTGGMTSARMGHTMNVLDNGKVLVSGGAAGEIIFLNFVTTAELYDPATATWSPTGSLSIGRIYHSATALPGGKVLVVGGAYIDLSTGGSQGVVLATSELYDQATGTWTPTGGLNDARFWHAATRLGNGVLVVGGIGMEVFEAALVASTEIFDPVGSAPTYPVTLTKTGPGTMTAAPTGAEPPTGTTVTLHASPDPGAIFLGWTVNGTLKNWDPSLFLTVRGPQTVSAAFAARPTYSDVAAGSAEEEAIAQLGARGIIKGYGDGTFGPNDPVLRAQMAALIARSVGWDAEDHGNSFPDRGAVDADLWRNVGTLAAYGVAKGYPDGSYDPTGPVLRAQVISFITRAMVAKGYWEPQPDDPAFYANVPAASGHRADIATFDQYVEGLPDMPHDGPFVGWDQPATRAWFARVLWQALNAYYGPPVLDFFP